MNYLIFRNKNVTVQDKTFWDNAYTQTIPGRKSSINEDLELPLVNFSVGHQLSTMINNLLCNNY